MTREPGGSPGAEIIRHIILSGAAKPLGAEAETMLFASARDDHLRTTIRPALERGAWVLCDRFADSTRVYQGIVGEVDFAADPGIGADHCGRNGTRPYFCARCAGRSRTEARRSAPRLGSMQTVLRAKRWISTKSCAPDFVAGAERTRPLRVD